MTGPKQILGLQIRSVNLTKGMSFQQSQTGGSQILGYYRRFVFRHKLVVIDLLHSWFHHTSE